MAKVIKAVKKVAAKVVKKRAPRKVVQTQVDEVFVNDVCSNCDNSGMTCSVCKNGRDN
jgi:hypothetical protein